MFAQSASSITLDADGITFTFPTSAIGRVVNVLAVNVGPIAAIRVGEGGRARLDLSNVPVPRNGRACFFLISQQSGQLVSASRQTGFHNPFWEQRSGSQGAGGAPRTVAAIQQEMAQFETDLTEARAYAVREDGRRIRDGQCTNIAATEQTRPAFAFEGDGARRYGAARCAAVIGPARNLTCGDVRTRAGLGDDPVFRQPDCDARLADARLALQGGARSREMAEDHQAIARTALDRATQYPTDRPALARQCIADVADRSTQALVQWRRDRDLTDTAEQQASSQCLQTLDLLTDADARRAALNAELATARTAQSSQRSAPRAASVRARDYPCPLS